MNVLSLGHAPKMRPLAAKRSTVVAALDLGTSKVACLVARLKPTAPQESLGQRSHAIDLIGFGHTYAQGMKAGAVIDLDAAEESIRRAVDQAERGAGVHIESVVVSLSGGRLDSELISAGVDIANHEVSDDDLARVLAAAGRYSVREGRGVLHSLPVGYALDGVHGIQDVRGMLGHRLSVDMHMATVDLAAIRNLMLVIERCHLSVEAMVASPYAAGLSVLAEDETDLGAAVIDLGAGTTTMAVFSGGRFLFAGGCAVGGRHVTMDLARCLNTRIADAERIKTLYGTVLPGGSDERDMIEVPTVGDDGDEPPQFVSRAHVVAIIRPRVEEILEMIRDRLAASPFAADPRGCIILAGGASQLSGIPELAAQMLGRPVRIGRPLGATGLPEEAKGPAFATATGLLAYPQTAHLEHVEPRRTRQAMTGTGGYITRVGRWLREGL